MMQTGTLSSRFPAYAIAGLLCCALAGGTQWAKAQGAQTARPSSSTSTKSGQSAAPSKAQAPTSRSEAKTFSSPQEASAALYAAARNNDENAMLVILGPNARDIVVWSDDAGQRKADLDNFVKKYDQMHRLVKEPDSETTLYVGAENWPLPIPLVEKNGMWYFDAELGRQEILYRRIGENESNAIDVLGAMVDAEHEYYDEQAGPGGMHEYAQRLNSDPGARDGLYWPQDGNAPVSPAGPHVAQASYNRPDHKPLCGYYFRILTEQGPNARGGARKYVVDGKMTGGFALVAFPAEYRSSGVKTFIADQDGTIYEKDLGHMTAKLAGAMMSYNPDATWTKVP